MRRSLCSRGFLLFAFARRNLLSPSTFVLRAVSAVPQQKEDTCLSRFSSSTSRVMATSGGATWAHDGVVSLLTQEEAKTIDEELMTVPGFSIDQLMELAGLSVAQAVHEFLAGGALAPSPGGAVLVLCGPGNNGGDGLVAARHLHHFGYKPTVVYPKRTSKELYINIVRQCENLGIEVSDMMPGKVEGEYAAVVDALLGFGATGPLRPPFDAMIGVLATLGGSKTPVISVDIPSGWDVEQGDVHGTGFSPAALVSLTAPKRCARLYTGRHFLGGRFVPPHITDRYKLKLPPYPGASQVVELQGWGGDVSRAASEDSVVVVWITAPNMEEAKALSDAIIDQQLAACVNIMPGIESVYKWEGKVERSAEVLMMAKTRSMLLSELTAFVKSKHSYDLPEIIAAPIVGGSSSYIQWVKDSTKAQS